MNLSRKLNPWKVTTLTVILLMLPLVSSVAGAGTSQSTTPPCVILFGAGARWAARDGTSALYVNWQDSWDAHHSTDGSNWIWWLKESTMENWRSSLTLALQQSGFEVTLAGDIPANLDDYNLVVLSAYYAIEPMHEPVIRDYVFNGGSVVLLAATPAYLAGYSKSPSTTTDLTSIQEWFGCNVYLNTGGTASPAFDNPFGTSLKESDVLYTTGGSSYAGVTSLGTDAEAIAFWSSGAVFAFTREYGAGRVYYQAITEDHAPADYEPPDVSPDISTSISISTDAPSSFAGFIVNVYGSLNDALGNGLFNETVFLYYTFPEYGSWIPVTSDTTNEFGEYGINWIPPATGSFTLKAEWKGNSTHSGSSDIVSLNTIPYEDERVFSVESNSTISALAFNSTSLELNFRVTGPDDTEGYVKFLVAKSIVSDPTSIKVYLDGKNRDYYASSFGDSWQLVFTYSHSTHDIAINLGVQSETRQKESLNSDLLIEYGFAAIIALVAVVGVGFIVYFKKRKH